MGGGNHDSEQHGVRGCAARTDQVCGDDGLAVSRLERMKGTEAGGDERRR